MADAVATTAGAVMGTSTTTTFVESASGVTEGGRTGLTSMTTAILFLLSLLPVPGVPGYSVLRDCSGTDHRRILHGKSGRSD